MVGRRGVLLGATGVGAAVGADLLLRRGSGHRHRPVVTPPPAPTADPALTAAASVERRLVEAYEQALGAHPALAPVLSVPLAQHRAHLAAFGGPSATPSQPPPAAPGPITEQQAAVQRTALRTLTARERSAAASYASAAVSDLAHGGLLASVSAAESVHVEELVAAAAAIVATAPPPRPPRSSAPRPTPTPRSTRTSPRPTPRPTRTSPKPAPTRSTASPRSSPPPSPRLSRSP